MDEKQHCNIKTFHLTCDRRLLSKNYYMVRMYQSYEKIYLNILNCPFRGLQIIQRAF